MILLPVPNDMDALVAFALIEYTKALGKQIESARKKFDAEKAKAEDKRSVVYLNGLDVEIKIKERQINKLRAMATLLNAENYGIKF